LKNQESVARSSVTPSVSIVSNVAHLRVAVHEACRQQRRGAGSGWTDGVTGCKRKREVAKSFVVEKLGGSFVRGLIERQSEIRSELELIVEEGVPGQSVTKT
jgi:hypothetical protein